MIGINDLMTPATAAQIVANITASLVAMKIPANQWRTSGSMSSFRASAAQQMAGFSTNAANLVAGLLLPYSTGNWLTALAYYFFGVTRIPATFPSGSYVLTNTGGGSFSGPSYAAGQVIFLDPTTGNTFTNVTAINLGPVGSGNATQTITIQGTKAGSAASSGPGAITTIVTTMVGVTGTNPVAVVGVDAQSDSDLRNVCLQSRAAASVRGPGNAYLFYSRYNLDPGQILSSSGLPVGATPLLNSGGTPVNINRVGVSTASHTGAVTVTLASPTGPVSGTDLIAAQANIFLYAYVPGTTLIVQSATAVNYGPTVNVNAKALPGVSTTNVLAAIQTAIAAYFANDIPVGGDILQAAAPSGVVQGVFGSGITATIGQAVASQGTYVVEIDGLTDLAMVGGQVAVDAITFNLRLV